MRANIVNRRDPDVAGHVSASGDAKARMRNVIASAGRLRTEPDVWRG